MRDVHGLFAGLGWAFFGLCRACLLLPSDLNSTPLAHFDRAAAESESVK